MEHKKTQKINKIYALLNHENNKCLTSYYTQVNVAHMKTYVLGQFSILILRPR